VGWTAAGGGGSKLGRIHGTGAVGPGVHAIILRNLFFILA